MALGDSASLTSAASEVPGGTSTAGEQLKNPCGCKGENKRTFSWDREVMTEPGDFRSGIATTEGGFWKAQTVVPWAWSRCVPLAWPASLPALGCGWAQIHTYRCRISVVRIMSCKLKKQCSISVCKANVYQRTMSVSSKGLSFFTQVAKPSWRRGFWLGNSPPGNFSSLLYGVTQRLCFKNPALRRNFASGRANGKQFEPGTSLKPVGCPVRFTALVFLTWSRCKQET